jgi:hypothetical protein
MAADQPSAAHEASHPLAPDVHAVVQAQLGMHPWGAVSASAALMDLPDLLEQHLVAGHPGRWRPPHPSVIARARHTQHAAQQGDSVVYLLLLDQPKRHGR